MLPLRSSLGLWLALVAGCGRLGFEATEPLSKAPTPIATDAGRDPTDLPADAGSTALEPDPDAGMGDGDGKPRNPEPYDAGPSVDAGLAPSDDAGSVASSDGGAPSDGSFGCTDYAGALACSAFTEPLESEWDLSSHHGEFPVLSDGYLDTQTYGDGADSYATASFGPFFGGTLYFRMRVMFPSDGDLSSVNFITVGNYADESDYGVELDAIDGRLSFNSSSDGFIDGDFVLARDRWLCIDARILLDDQSGELSARVDGQLALDVTGVDTVPSAGTTLVDVGIDWTRSPQDYGHVLVDDFVISRDALSCP